MSWITRGAPAGLVLLIAAAPASAWHDEGHYYTALAAVRSLPDESAGGGGVPAFFRDGAETIAHLSIDPDLFKHRDTPALRVTEEPEHYFDIELLGDHDVPRTRGELIALANELDIEPDRIGFLPYAIEEWTQRLTLAFAEHRKYPDNPHIRMKCLVYAGLLAHYTADLKMPLHVTVEWNGRLNEQGESSGTGIHHKIDALPTKVTYNVLFADPLPAPTANTDIFAFTLIELDESRSHIDRAYELEPHYPETADLKLDHPEVIAFTIDRTRAAAAFTASIMLSAWENSAHVEPPFWLDRTIFDETFDPSQIPPQPERETQPPPAAANTDASTAPEP